MNGYFSHPMLFLAGALLLVPQIKLYTTQAAPTATSIEQHSLASRNLKSTDEPFESNENADIVPNFDGLSRNTFADEMEEYGRKISSAFQDIWKTMNDFF